MLRHLSLPLACIVFLLLTSCRKKDEPAPNQSASDYAIESTNSFTLLSQHENGWIKKGEYRDYQGRLTKDFEYYENGFIKVARLYNSYPEHHLYLEVSRSEDNQPQWSRYYNLQGDLWFEWEYENGITARKIVYSQHGTAYHNYQQGEISSIVYESADKSTRSTVSYLNGSASRNLTISQNEEILWEEELPITEEPGTGAYMHTDVPVANPFAELEPAYYRVAQAYSSSPVWKVTLEPQEHIFMYRLHDEFYNPIGQHATKLALSTPVYRNIIEQYPFSENGVLVGGGYYIDGYKAYSSTIGIRDSLRQLYQQDSALYCLKYGNEYAEKVAYGKSYMLIGAIRNLPTNSTAARQIKEAAQKYLHDIQTNRSSLSEAEKALLSKVWFELKFFSNLKPHQQGIVVSSNEEFEALLAEFNAADNDLLQIDYRTNEYL